MIENFEDITTELNDAQMQLIPILIKGFKSHTKENPIKGPEIVKNMQTYLQHQKIKISEPRLRK